MSDSPGLRAAKRLLLIYLVTMLGSSLTTVGTFISIESSLSSTYSLSLALSLRTLAFFAFS
ncbi:MAG TPA: hypothetical protein VM598_08720, partial [Bdellovibrionota bacterium]|nr:hypothetical protein [Bdellovibrionota bacterium]